MNKDAEKFIYGENNLPLIGDSVAEYDKNLLSYFVGTVSYKNILMPDCLFVKGRKGSGKSAITKKIKDNFSNDDVYYVSLDPKDINLNGYIDILESKKSLFGNQLQNILKKCWEKMYLLTLMQLTLSNTQGEEKGELKYVQSYLNQQKYVTQFLRYTDLLNGIVNYLEDESSSPVLLSEKIDRYFSLEEYQIAVKELKDFILGKPYKYAVLMDGIDDNDFEEAMSEMKNKELKDFFSSLINSLFYSINPILREKVMLKVFLTYEVYTLIDMMHYDKLISSTVNVEWDVKSLKKLICSRLEKATNSKRQLRKFKQSPESYYDKIWEYYFPKEILIVDDYGRFFKKNLLSFMITRTSRRPRDLINLVKQIFSSLLSEGGDKITPENIKEGFRNYSNAHLEAVQCEFKYTLTNLISFGRQFSGQSRIVDFQALRKIVNDSFNCGDPERVVEVIKVLYKIGFIGLISVSAKSAANASSIKNKELYFYDGVPNVDPSKGDQKVCIHPSFCDALNIATGEYIY